MKAILVAALKTDSMPFVVRRRLRSRLMRGIPPLLQNKFSKPVARFAFSFKRTFVIHLGQKVEQFIHWEQFLNRLQWVSLIQNCIYPTKESSRFCWITLKSVSPKCDFSLSVLIASIYPNEE